MELNEFDGVNGKVTTDTGNVLFSVDGGELKITSDNYTDASNWEVIDFLNGIEEVGIALESAKKYF